MQPEDRIRLTHMLDSAEAALEFVRGRSASDLDTDRMLYFAVVRAVEIIGEAANQISPSTRRELDAIPWAGIIGMRHRLVHAYFDVSMKFLWSTVSEEIPKLIPELQRLLR